MELLRAQPWRHSTEDIHAYTGWTHYPPNRRREMVTRNTLAAALASTSLVLPAQAQNFCQTSGDKISLGFEVKPSLVAHSDAIMETTFDDVSLPGGDEGLFSFKRTIGAILESAGATNDQASRVAFVQTMLDSFPTADGFALNPAAGVLMPLDAREERSDLIATALLDESSDQAMKPLAVFNRFDLAPADFAHCGEYRIVYGKANPNNPTPNRFLLIFEAAVPNPGPAAGEEGCRPITEFWAGLSEASDDTEIAKRLSAFFYEGKTDPDLTEPDLIGPVVDYRNYGGDGSRGQVRGNLFTQLPWQLREWLTQETFDPANPLAFVRDMVNDNPLAELYEDDITGPPLGPPQNVASALTALHGDFVASLTSDIRDNLMSEETDKHRELEEDLEHYDLGTGPTKQVDESKILLHTIALGNDPRFNEHQSTSLGTSDEIATKVGPVMRSVLEQVGAIPSPEVNPQTAEVIIARAQAGTCAGCHELSPGDVVREIPNQADVLWPDVVKDTTSSPFPNSEGFVHVRETDRMLSPALEESFLPFRRYVLGHHLCPPPEPPAPAVAALGGFAEADAALAALEDVPAPRSPGVMRFVDAIVADFVAAPTEAAGAPADAMDEQPARAAEAIAQLDPVAREALRQRVHRAIAEARREEQDFPGAFVEVRRPH
jgi:hypothetical protein